jgi:type VI secretion system secreted protein VgrG
MPCITWIDEDGTVFAMVLVSLSQEVFSDAVLFPSSPWNNSLAMSTLGILTPEPLRRQTRPIALEIPDARIDDDLLRVESVQGQESISQPYEFEVEVRVDDNPQIKGPVSFDDLVGKRARLRIGMPWKENRFGTATAGLSPAPQWENDTPARFFHGVIAQVSLGTPGVYTLSVKSSLHKLTLRNRYFIYENQTIEEVIRQLLKSECQLDQLQLRFLLDGPIVARVQDWLQAGESDYALLQRLMGKESIHYFFVHEKDRCTLVFSNQTVKPDLFPVPGSAEQPPKLRYTYTAVDKLGTQQVDLLADFRYMVKMTQAGVRSVMTRAESEWEDNAVAGYTSYAAEKGQARQTSSFHEHKVYQFGVDAKVAGDKSCKAWQQISTERGSLSGNTTSPLLSPGYVFKLFQSLDADAKNAGNANRPQFDNRLFVVTKIQHKASSSGPYQGSVEATAVDENTLLTPFSMENTQQGSLLAKVLRDTLPSGWRYREKCNFEFSVDNNSALGESFPEKGCLVQLATATGDNDVFWVRLAQHMQTVPEVGAMVLVARSSTENELPEIQSVIASHGSKCVQPPDRANASWQANTMWGSNYSTNYGDGISMRFGNRSSVNFEQAKKLVEMAYDQPGPESTQMRDTSFSKGGSFSASVSDNADAGTLSASISQGCNYSESHGKRSYNFSSIQTSESVSQVGKSVSRSVVGEYSGSVDLDKPSFVAGKLPDQAIRTLSDTLGNGDSYNQSTVIKRSINLSGVGISAPSDFDASATSYSGNKVVGKTVSKSDNNGDIESTNTVVGNTTSTSTNTGNITSTNTVTGDTTSTSTNTGNITNTSTVTGDTTSTSTNTGNITSTNTVTGDTASTSTNTGNITSTNTVTGNTTSTSTNTGNITSTNTVTGNTTSTSTNTGNITSTNTVTGNTTSTSTNTGNVTSTNTVTNTQTNISVVGISVNSSAIGISNSNSATGISNSNGAVGLSNSNQVTGVSANISATGVSGSVSVTGSSTSVNVVGNNNSVECVGPGFLVSSAAAKAEARLKGIEADIITLKSTL